VTLQTYVLKDLCLCQLGDKCAVVHINILVHVLSPTGPDGGHDDHDQDSLDCPHGPLTVFGLWLVCSTEVLIVSYQSKYSNYLVSCPQWVSLQKYFRCL
jgi:hypothetical protein